MEANLEPIHVTGEVRTRDEFKLGRILLNDDSTLREGSVTSWKHNQLVYPTINMSMYAWYTTDRIAAKTNKNHKINTGSNTGQTLNKPIS